MDNKRTCSFIGCNNTSFNKNSCFYKFPEDFNLCLQWVEIIGCREFFEDFAFQGPEPFLGRFICSDHFTEEDFVDCNDIYSGLKNGAVPFYFIPNRKPEGSHANISVKTEPPEGDFWDPNDITSSSVFPVDILKNVKVEEVSSQFGPSGEPLQSTFLDFNGKNKRAQAVAIRRAKETPEQLAERRLQNAQRASLRRKLETPEEKEMRRKANAERQARKRMMETPEQREVRRVKDLLRARQRRWKESEEETRIRRMQDAARAQARRRNESDEEKILRRLRDLRRVTNRRRNETDEERMERLKKNREYSAKKRYIQRLEQEITHPKNLIDDTFLALRNFEQDMTALNASFFHSLTAYNEQQKSNQFRCEDTNGMSSEVLHNIEENIAVPNLNNVHLNSLAYSHFLLNSSLYSQSSDGNSEESMRSYSNDSSDNQGDDVLPSGIEHCGNRTSGKREEIFLQT